MTKADVIEAVDEIIKGGEEVEVLRRHRISPEVFDRLLNDPGFARDVNNRIGLSIVRTRLLIAQYAQAATAKLISMTNCEKEETARKACLDVITLAQKQSEPTLQKEEVSKIVESATPTELTPEQASKMLAVLAKPESDSG